MQYASKATVFFNCPFAMFIVQSVIECDIINKLANKMSQCVRVNEGVFVCCNVALVLGDNFTMILKSDSKLNSLVVIFTHEKILSAKFCNAHFTSSAFNFEYCIKVTFNVAIYGKARESKAFRIEKERT